jgi:arylsulfatase A-like enzyme
MVAHWFGKIKPGRIVDHISGFQDVMPTLEEAAGYKIDRPIDGKSFLPALTGEGEQKCHEYLYWELGGNQAVRMNQWKAISRAVKGEKAAMELYDLEKDIGETKDLAGEHPEIIKKMKAILRKARKPSKLFPSKLLDSLDDK